LGLLKTESKKSHTNFTYILIKVLGDCVKTQLGFVFVMVDKFHDSLSTRLKLFARFGAKKILPILKMLLLVTVSTTRHDVAPSMQAERSSVEWN